MFLIIGHKGVWYIRYKQANGKWTNKTTGTKNEIKAGKFLKKFLQKDEPEVKLSRLTLEQLINHYIKVKCNGDTSKAEIMKHRFCNLLLNYFSKERIVSTLTAFDFEKYRQDRLKQIKHFDKSKTISPVTINIELRSYKALFNKAIRWELIEKNPLYKFPLCKIVKRNKLTITDDEKNKLLKSIQHPVVKNVVIFILLTGCRISEVLNLQWKNVNFKDKIISIISNKDWNTKTGEIRQIPVSPELETFLKNLYINNNTDSINFLDRYVFCKSSGYKYQSGFISRKFKHYVRKCKIDDYIHIHSLRHTAITDLIRSGESINKVKEFIGHKNIATTLGYTHLVIDDLRDTATKLSVSNL